MNPKDIFKNCISIVYDDNYFPPLYDNRLTCNDQLLHVGFKTFTIGNERWFAFKPTIAKRNWVTNFLFPLFKIPYNNKDTPIRVHGGFLSCYLALRDEIHSIMKSDKQSTSIVCCGHSLGGALARLAAVDIQYNFCTPVSVYTAGAPNIGNKAFEESFTKRITNTAYYSIKGDPVPMVPPKLFGYTKYTRISLPRKYSWRFWLNHMPAEYIKEIS